MSVMPSKTEIDGEHRRVFFRVLVAEKSSPHLDIFLDVVLEPRTEPKVGFVHESGTKTFERVGGGYFMPRPRPAVPEASGYANLFSVRSEEEGAPRGRELIRYGLATDADTAFKPFCRLPLRPEVLLFVAVGVLPDEYEEPKGITDVLSELSQRRTGSC